MGRLVTLNLGVYCRVLDHPLNPREYPRPEECHWIARIGDLSHEKEDKWWTLSSDAEAARAIDEMGVLLLSVGLPALSRIQSCRDLRALWESGECTGLTEKWRDTLLAVLRNRLPREP
jgi:hypothetical protein